VHTPLAYELEDTTIELGEHIRRPLSRTLKALLGTVAIAAIGLGAFTVGQSQTAHVAPPHPAPSAPAAAPVPAPAPQPAAEVPAPGARADDQQFLAMLSRDGIPRPDSVPDAIALASDICQMIQRGDDIGYVQNLLAVPRGIFTQHQAEAFAADAHAAYCPHAGMSG
jgi:hypothetical protein